MASAATGALLHLKYAWTPPHYSKASNDRILLFPVACKRRGIDTLKIVLNRKRRFENIEKIRSIVTRHRSLLSGTISLFCEMDLSFRQAVLVLGDRPFGRRGVRVRRVTFHRQID